MNYMNLVLIIRFAGKTSERVYEDAKENSLPIVYQLFSEQPFWVFSSNLDVYIML